MTTKKKKKWGKIGPPGSKKRREHLTRIAGEAGRQRAYDNWRTGTQYGP